MGNNIIVAVLVTLFLAFVCFAIGFSAGRLATQKQAIVNNVAHYSVDKDGDAEFTWGK